MKITVLSRNDEVSERYDYKDRYVIKINDDEVFDVYDGEPEDSNLNRDFSDVYSIPNLLQKVFNAGKNGECLTIEYEDLDD